MVQWVAGLFVVVVVVVVVAVFVAVVVASNAVAIREKRQNNY